MTAPRTWVEPDDSEFDGVTIEFIDEAEATRILDQRTHEWLGISVEEFSRAFCAGDLTFEDRHVGMLYFMMGPAGIECDAR
jgi:hypothetical protein